MAPTGRVLHYELLMWLAAESAELICWICSVCNIVAVGLAVAVDRKASIRYACSISSTVACSCNSNTWYGSMCRPGVWTHSVFILYTCAKPVVFLLSRYRCTGQEVSCARCVSPFTPCSGLRQTPRTVTPRTGGMHICQRIGRLAALSLRSLGQCVGS